MDFITIVYLVYSFIAFYFLFLFILIYTKNRKYIYYAPKLTKKYSLSMVVPCYNEEKSIAGTIQALLSSSYKNLKKIIVVDDCSTDGSYEIIKKFAKKYPRVMAVQTPKNTGRASGSKNYGAKFVKTELIGFADADSYPQKSAITKMVGFFNNKKVGAVTSSVLVKERKRFIEKLQAIEYKIIVFTRKLLGFVEAIYVTPGPLAIYRKSAFDDIGGFDENNLTEDIEITWHMVVAGYKVEMCVPARVYTVAPDTFKAWYKQRIRWNVGGIQTISKYRKAFLQLGMLGSFILPFFVLSWALGISGIFILAYRIFQRVVVHYLASIYSVQAQTAILTLREINLTPNVLVFFGTAILVMSLSFTLVALAHTREKDFKRTSLINLFFYSFVYLLAYPLILITSIYKFLKRKRFW
jgi:cellulose synthase/poly-beta-1,6-N-acetylglucosamine synthase-like glycosyltransferase